MCANQTQQSHQQPKKPIKNPSTSTTPNSLSWLFPISQSFHGHVALKNSQHQRHLFKVSGLKASVGSKKAPRPFWTNLIQKIPRQFSNIMWSTQVVQPSLMSQWELNIIHPMVGSWQLKFRDWGENNGISSNARPASKDLKNRHSDPGGNVDWLKGRNSHHLQGKNVEKKTYIWRGKPWFLVEHLHHLQEKTMVLMGKTYWFLLEHVPFNPLKDRSSKCRWRNEGIVENSNVGLYMGLYDVWYIIQNIVPYIYVYSHSPIYI